MLQLSVDDVAEDLKLAMRVCAKAGRQLVSSHDASVYVDSPFSWIDPVFIDDSQVAPFLEAVVLVPKGVVRDA